jgi:multidrug resistance efflux pump
MTDTERLLWELGNQIKDIPQYETTLESAKQAATKAKETALAKMRAGSDGEMRFFTSAYKTKREEAEQAETRLEKTKESLKHRQAKHGAELRAIKAEAEESIANLKKQIEDAEKNLESAILIAESAIESCDADGSQEKTKDVKTFLDVLKASRETLAEKEALFANIDEVLNYE